MIERCPWAGDDALYLQYHDEEWGVPSHDDSKHFEFLVLESAQAGLSWITILRRRDNYRAAYSNYKPELVAKYKTSEINKLLNNPGIIRNRLKSTGVSIAISGALLTEIRSQIVGKPYPNYLQKPFYQKKSAQT